MRYSWILLACLAIGCGSENFHTKKPVAMNELPELVLNAAQKKAPEVKFDNALLKSDGVYEVRGKTKKGKIVEIEVNESGEVLAVE